MTQGRNAEISNPQWQIAGLIILCVRFVQGWIFWGGGSRRFIYAPQKLDPYTAQWMANKLQSAMPGALLGMSHVISYLLQHFVLLYSAIIIFSLVELISGVALILGVFSRAAGFITAGLSISLMLIFGWEGSTCLDEWTMAVSNLAMGLTLALSGSPLYSVDHLLMHHHPALIKKSWFVLLASGPINFTRFKRISILFALFTIFFTMATYDYYRGAILTRYHAGPVSAVTHHILLDKGLLLANGQVTFNAYVNAGNTAIPSYIVRIELLNAKGVVVEEWDGKQLSVLPIKNIQNTYLYNRLQAGAYGIVAPVSAKAAVTLMPSNKRLHLLPGKYLLQVYTVEGQRFSLPINF